MNAAPDDSALDEALFEAAGRIVEEFSHWESTWIADDAYAKVRTRDIHALAAALKALAARKGIDLGEKK